MDHRSRTTQSRRFRQIIRNSALVGLATSWVGPAAQGQAELNPPRLATVSPLASAPPLGGTTGTGEADEAQVVEYGGKVVAGKRIELNLQGVEAPGARYEWTQVEGPPLRIEGPTEPRISLVVPANAQRLGFVLAVSDGRGGTKRFRVNVPVQTEPTPAVETTLSPPSPGCRAEAGDDQIGLVGRRLALDGSGSGPTDGLLYRWLQVAGPAAGEPRQDGPYFSFRPTAPGFHRFALIVASTTISEPDYVTVTVGEFPAPGGQATATMGPSPTSRPDLSQLTLEMIALGAALAPNGTSVAGALADAFDAVAGGLPNYPTYAAAQADLARRCDAIVPSDPAARAQWVRLVLEPLTQYTVGRLATVGLDPRSPASTQQPMASAQRQQLDDVFRSIARVLRPQVPIAR